MTEYIAGTLFHRLMLHMTGPPVATVLWLILSLLLTLGFCQLAYSILQTFFPRTAEVVLIVGGILMGVALLFLPWDATFILWASVAGLLVGLAAFYARAWRQRRRLTPGVLKELDRHVVMVDQEGRGLDIRPRYLGRWLPIPRFSPYPKEEFDMHIRALLDGIRRPEFPVAGGQSHYDRVVIFVHGGLNDYQDALLRASQRLRDMRSESGEAIYPIFVLWRSGLIPCYWAHLTEFRQGRTPIRSLHGRIFLTLANLLADVGRGLTRLPKTAYYQVLSDLSVLRPGVEPDARNVTELYKRLRQLHAVGRKRKPLQLKKKDDQRDKDQDTWLSDDPGLFLELLNPVKIAVRYAVWPLVDAFGSSAWDIMLRHTHTLFRSPYEFDITAAKRRDRDRKHPYAPEPYDPSKTTHFRQMLDTMPSGGLSMFVRAFMAAQSEADDPQAPAGFPRRVTLIGHSMGAIVINNWLRLFRSFRAGEIVHMAPACRIDDALEVLNPYLLRFNATFHILCLHPKAERSEQHAFGLAPLGSLLEWIDNFFSKPLTFDQRTLGKWDNILQSTHLIEPQVRDRVHIKAFSIRADSVDLSDEEREACRRSEPKHWSPLEGHAIISEALHDHDDVKPPIAHGEFTACRFWRPGFYFVRPGDRAQSTPEEAEAAGETGEAPLA